MTLTPTQQRVLDALSTWGRVSITLSNAPSAKGRAVFSPPIPGARQASLDALVAKGLIEVVDSHDTPDRYGRHGVDHYGGYEIVYRLAPS